MPTLVEPGLISASSQDCQALAEVERILQMCSDGPVAGSRPRLVGSDGEAVELPDALLGVLRQAVHHLLAGHSVSIAPLQQELTTQQAADLLNVSRPYLVQLLEAGCIPFTKTGTHRRVRLGDVLAYKQDRDARRQISFDRLAAVSQELGLYDE
jgi:excisionase family DNA binding protein